MLRFFITFVVLLATLFGLELTPWAQQYFVVPWTNALAAISAWFVTVIDPDVAATGKILRSIEDNVGEVAITQVEEASAMGKFAGAGQPKVGDTVKNK